jgi:hypothetical protein
MPKYVFWHVKYTFVLTFKHEYYKIYIEII